MDPCYGCSGNIVDAKVGCLICCKKDGKILTYSIIQEKCPCQNCIIKMKCKSFCSIIENNIEEYGELIDV